MAYQHILVPFDGSPLSRAALAAGAWIAWKGQAAIDLVRVVPPPDTPFTPRSLPGLIMLAAQDQKAALARAQTELAEEAHSLRGSGLRATGMAFPGEPAAVLLDCIERREVDLVVMGTHGRGIPQRWLLGSVAIEVTRRSPASVLLLPREARFSRDDKLRVLVGLDGSLLAEEGLKAALLLADTVPVELTLLQVLPGSAPDPDHVTMDWYEKPVLGASPYLDELQQRLLEKGNRVRRAYSTGSAADEIVGYAERGAFDLIALGSHGRSGIARLMLGSVAEQAVRQAQTPILIARGPQLAPTSPAIPDVR